MWCVLKLLQLFLHLPVAPQDAVRVHYEANTSDFSGCPTCRYVGMVDPFKMQVAVAWSYSFGGEGSFFGGWLGLEQQRLLLHDHMSLPLWE